MIDSTEKPNTDSIQYYSQKLDLETEMINTLLELCLFLRRWKHITSHLLCFLPTLTWNVLSNINRHFKASQDLKRIWLLKYLPVRTLMTSDTGITVYNQTRNIHNLSNFILHFEVWNIKIWLWKEYGYRKSCHHQSLLSLLHQLWCWLQIPPAIRKKKK